MMREYTLACPFWVLSSAGRASPLQGEGRGFDPLSTHHIGEARLSFLV